MKLQEELQLLNDYESKDNTVLSIYLNTDPADPSNVMMHGKSTLKMD